MKLETGKRYTANPQYTNLMNRERDLERQIARLQKERASIIRQKAQTAPYIKDK